jgi:hypothetical protein
MVSDPMARLIAPSVATTEPEMTKRSRESSGAFHFQAVLRTVLRTARQWAVLRTSSSHAAVGVSFCCKVRFPPEAVGFSSIQVALRSSVGLAIRQRNRAM